MNSRYSCINSNMTDYDHHESDFMSTPPRRGILKQHPQPGEHWPHRMDRSATDSLFQDSASSQHELPDRSQRTPVKAVPQSSEKVISALKDLQEKIKRMELERTAAEKRLNSLNEDTSRCRDALNQGRTRPREATDDLSRRTHELQGQLHQAEDRCAVVERQLSQMRNLVQRAELDRDSALRQRDVHGAYTVQSKEAELRSQQDRLHQLEMERERLKMTQSAAERKIRDLEERVLEEQHQKKLIQDKAAELRTVAETNRILLEAEKVSSPSTKQPKRKRRKKRVETATSRANASPGNLHVKVGKIPFVAGQSTTPSHSLNANMQNVLALMRTHNPAWCVNGVNSPHRVGPPKKRKKGQARRVPLTEPANGDLSDLLQCLQDEFGIMSCEHRELARQVQEAEDSNLREGLEAELEQLVARMELKGQQFAKLKRHREQLSEKRTHRKSASQPSLSKPKRMAGKKCSESEVQVITTVRTSGKRAGPIRVSSGTNRERGVQMLRDIQSLQTSLRKDDLSWD